MLLYHPSSGDLLGSAGGSVHAHDLLANGYQEVKWMTQSDLTEILVYVKTGQRVDQS